MENMISQFGSVYSQYDGKVIQNSMVPVTTNQQTFLGGTTLQPFGSSIRLESVQARLEHRSGAGDLAHTLW